MRSPGILSAVKKLNREALLIHHGSESEGENARVGPLSHRARLVWEGTLNSFTARDFSGEFLVADSGYEFRSNARPCMEAGIS